MPQKLGLAASRPHEFLRERAERAFEAVERLSALRSRERSTFVLRHIKSDEGDFVESLQKLQHKDCSPLRLKPPVE